MIRITPVAGKTEVGQLLVEGRITHEDVEALRSTCEAAAAGSRTGTIILDLSGVSFVDSPGVVALGELERRGVMLIGCSPFVDELLGSRQSIASRDSDSDGAECEAELTERLRRGDDAAFETLVREYGGRMLVVARRLLGSEDDARDAVQDAFLSAFRRIDSFEGSSRVSTWLHRIVVNAALMKMRSRRCRPEKSIEDLLPRFDDGGDWIASTSSLGLPGDVVAERRETREVVRRAIDQLPDTYRTVLLLRDIEELDTEEAAKVLGITPNAVKIRLHRARQALRTLLERDLGTFGASPTRRFARPISS
ncbi:MAG: sigma-70 family RNA polymerase sigma factor [Planctomycetes bacterium]|nr:sigma-70 family RNA polymerase sigma factor [Planctomycetota bacterium]MBI3843711.1 sigma-70 family RNA polymerase sigma factor [Planctomycetota bacterium]